MIVTTADDYATLIKDYKAPNQQKSLWEQFLTGTQQQYQSAAQQVQAATSYDISSAYANYKQQQLQLMMNNQLGAGFKEQVGSGLQQQYEAAYDKFKAQESSALATIVEQQAATLNKAETEIAKKGAFAKKFETAVYDFAQLNKDLLGYDLSNSENIYKSVEEGGLGFYKTTKNDKGEVTYELTDYGKDFYDKVLHSPSTSMKFKEYLEEEGLYEDYLSNADFYNSIIGGLEYGDRDYSEDERLALLRAEERKTAYEEIKTHTTNNEILDKIYGTGLENLSAEESRKILENVKRTNDYVGTKKAGGITGKDDVIKDIYGNKWTTTTYNISYDPSNAGLIGTKHNKARQLGEKLGIINKKGYVKENNYRDNDIIYVDGHYYYITDLNVKKNRFAYMEIRPGDWNYEGAVREIF